MGDDIRIIPTAYNFILGIWDVIITILYKEQAE